LLILQQTEKEIFTVVKQTPFVTFTVRCVTATDSKSNRA